MEPRHLAHRGAMVATKDPAQTVKLTALAQPFGRLHAAEDPDSASQPAASIAELGRGKNAATYFSVGRSYLASHSETLRGFLLELVRQLFPKPLVEVRGSSDVDLAVARNHGGSFVARIPILHVPILRTRIVGDSADKVARPRLPPLSIAPSCTGGRVARDPSPYPRVPSTD